MDSPCRFLRIARRRWLRRLLVVPLGLALLLPAPAAGAAQPSPEPGGDWLPAAGTPEYAEDPDGLRCHFGETESATDTTIDQRATEQPGPAWSSTAAGEPVTAL